MKIQGSKIYQKKINLRKKVRKNQKKSVEEKGKMMTKNQQNMINFLIIILEENVSILSLKVL